MDLWQSLLVVVRRWYVAAPLLILTVVVALGASEGIAPEYRAKSDLLLLAPTTQPVEGGGVQSGNPYLSSAAGLATTAQALQLSALSGETTALLNAEGLSTNYQIGTGTRSPIISLEAVSDDAAIAGETVTRLTEILRERLDAREEAAAVSDDQRIQVDVLRQTGVGIADFQAQSRVRILILVLGGILSIGAAFAAEGLLRGRSASGEAARWPGEGETAEQSSEVTSLARATDRSRSAGS